jgi:monovalent cation/hydrogen antiporter
VSGVDVALLVLALTLGSALLARCLPIPAPVTLAIIGAFAGGTWHFIPALPPVRVPPDHVLFAFLPPLITSAAYALPLQAFRRNLRPIASLAIGLVLATMAVVAIVAHTVGGLPWAWALVLGAIVSPPDPIAATAVAGKTGLPHRLVVILEGEGLVNDALAIVAYGLALDAAVTGKFTIGGAGLALLREVPTGIIVGLVIGWLVAKLRRQLDDVPLEVGISLFVPYATYEIADRVGASGVLALVTLGFVLRHYATVISQPVARLAERTVWGALRFASGALVFLLLGLLVGEIAVRVFTREMLWPCIAVSAVVILIRFAWMAVVPGLWRLIGVQDRSPRTTGRQTVVLGWAGMRGVVSLALALAVPGVLQESALSAPGPRQDIIVLTFAVIVATLIIQGLTLLPVVQWLGVGDPGREARDEKRVRARARRAGLAALERLAASDGRYAGACKLLSGILQQGGIGIAVEGVMRGDPERAEPIAQALTAQRRVVETMGGAGRIGGALAERLVTEIDVDEMSAQGQASRLTGLDVG